ncbi:polysaccharide deacetylase family protein [Limoniibacter endophyticus]|uniref:Chitooligosaccharide deacetylase n=1 Tax=Limoniibacter endophyticus TaxID=1565040 RepID=A0A8J3DGV4_9HYPH|nr:polysaccharide deacetylase family protein [Limoniibacter endophyticus]GHC66286.1 polysaccharide deacetylase [Limoniibacter endophyticus]
MPLPDDYLVYPARRHGMDHERYGWSDLFKRPKVEWPNGAKIALWVMPAAQWFPLDSKHKPFRAPGGLSMPFPDYRYYTNRDYGNRVGSYRILKILQERGIRSSFAVNGVIAERYPQLVQDIVEAGHEIVGHGLHMDQLHHSGLSGDEEQTIIAESLSLLRELSGQAVTGWLSPGRAQSYATPDILVRNGIRYACDWANDDMPYVMDTSAGQLLAMPHAYETDDRVVMLDFHHTETSWVEQIKDRFDVLYREADTYGGRILSLPLHGFVAGVPYRATYLKEVLDYVLGHDGVWVASGAEIADAFSAQINAERAG